MEEIATISEVKFEERQMSNALQILERLGAVTPYNSKTTKLLKRGVPDLGVPYTTIEVTTTPDSIKVRHPGKPIKSESNITSHILCSTVVYDQPLDFFRQLGYNVTLETTKLGKKTLINGIQIAVYSSNGAGVLEFSTTSQQKLLGEVYETIKELQLRFKSVTLTG